MAPAGIRMALVEGEDGDGLIVEEECLRLGADDSDTNSAPNQVISAILGTREGAVDAGLRLSSVGVTWTDKVQAAALRDALAAYKVENVMLVSAFLAAAALGQEVGDSIGYQRTAVLFIEPDSATLAVVSTADGSVCDVRHQLLADDDDTAVAEILTMVSDAESMETQPDGMYVVGSGVDVAMIKPELEAATSLTVSAPEEHEMALARGAALASGHAPLFASSTAALAYAQDFGTGAVELDSIPGYLRGTDVPGDDDRAYSAVPDDVADAETAVVGVVDPEGERRRPVLLVGSAMAVIAIAAVIALEIALAIGIRPMVALQPTPSQNHLVAPAQPAPAPAQVAAPVAPKVNLPTPSGPRAVSPHVPAPLPAAPVAPAPAAPRVPDPDVVVPPVAPILVPPVRAPVPDQLLRPRRRWGRRRCSRRCRSRARRFRFRHQESSPRFRRRRSVEVAPGGCPHPGRAASPACPVAVPSVAVRSVAARSAAAAAMAAAPSVGGPSAVGAGTGPSVAVEAALAGDTAVASVAGMAASAATASGVLFWPPGRAQERGTWVNSSTKGNVREIRAVELCRGVQAARE
jgi:hypothetical protein